MLIFAAKAPISVHRRPGLPTTVSDYVGWWPGIFGGGHGQRTVSATLPATLRPEEGFDRGVEIEPPIALSDLGVQLPLLGELDEGVHDGNISETAVS